MRWYSDEMENLDLKNLLKKPAPGMLGTFGEDVLELNENGNTRPEKKLQAQMLSEMMAIDHQRAVTSMKAWAKFVQLASRTRTTPFETLADYIPARVIDAGEL